MECLEHGLELDVHSVRRLAAKVAGQSFGALGRKFSLAGLQLVVLQIGLEFDMVGLWSCSFGRFEGGRLHKHQFQVACKHLEISYRRPYCSRKKTARLSPSLLLPLSLLLLLLLQRKDVIMRGSDYGVGRTAISASVIWSLLPNASMGKARS